MQIRFLLGLKWSAVPSHKQPPFAGKSQTVVTTLGNEQKWRLVGRIGKQSLKHLFNASGQLIIAA